MPQACGLFRNAAHAFLAADTIAHLSVAASPADFEVITDSQSATL